MKMVTLTIGRQKIRAAVWPGSVPGIPLLLFNGIGARLELLAPFANALRDVETIAFDVPGAGESPTPRTPYRFSALARVAIQVLDQLGVGQVDVLGVSWGGLLAQQFAIDHAQRCRRLVLAATAHGLPMLPGRLSVLLNFLTPRRYNDPIYRRAIAGRIYGGAARTKAGLMRELGPLMESTGKVGYLFQQLAIVGWSSVSCLPFLRQRTLVMAGDDDPVIPLMNARVMAWLIPKARLHVMHDGHLFLISNAVESSAIVRAFLAEEEPGTSRSTFDDSPQAMASNA